MIRGWLRSPSTHFLYKIVYFVVFWLFRVVYRHRIYGIENIPSGAALLAANHVSFLDPPILSISSPEEVHFLARKSLFANRWFASLIRNLNAHPVSGKAQDVAVFKTIVQVLKMGKKIIIFPEGTRSKDGKMQPIKPGISMLISRTDSVVVPAYIYGTYAIWPPRKMLPKIWGKTACVFGKPLICEANNDQDKKARQEELANKIEKAILDLKDWYERGAKGTPP